MCRGAEGRNEGAIREEGSGHMATLVKSKKLASGFTVIDNRIFRDYRLSLRATGLLTKLIALPDEWSYSLAGLASLCADGKDSVRSAVRELEELGYLYRGRRRDAAGRLGESVYLVFDEPETPENAACELAAQGCDFGVSSQLDTSVGKPDTGCDLHVCNSDAKADANDDGFTNVGKANVGEPGPIKYLSNKERIESNKTVHDAASSDEPNRPSVDDVAKAIETEASRIGKAIADTGKSATRFLDYNESRGWVRGGRPVDDWTELVPLWTAKEPDVSGERSPSHAKAASDHEAPRRRPEQRHTAQRPPFRSVEDLVASGILGKECLDDIG